MPKANVLFSFKDFPSHDCPLDAEAGDVAGLAEWFDAVPALFLLLIGEGQRAPSSIVDSGDAEVVLATPMTAARERCRVFGALAGPLLPAAPHAELDRIQAMLDGSPHAWLVLDTIEFGWKGDDDAALAAHLQQLQATGAALAAALQHAGVQPATASAADLPALLRPLVDACDREWGWWSPEVIARLHAVEDLPSEERPAFLQALNVKEWSEQLGAYEVRPQRRGARRKGDELAIGLVTPYGRWLLPFEAGATFASPSYDNSHWIIVGHHSADDDAAAASQACTDGLMDCNGLWRYPLGSFRYARVISDDWLLAAFTTSAKGAATLSRISTGETLHTGLEGAFIDDDGLLRLHDGQGRMAVTRTGDGQILVPFRYQHVRHFDSRKRWAVMENAKGQEGVIDIDGRELIPCRHRFIMRGNRDAPPKVFRRNRFIGLDYEPMTLTLYDLEGQTVSGPHFFGTDAYGPIVEGERLLTLDGNGPGGLVQWIDFDGKTVEVTDTPWIDFYTARREGRVTRRKKGSEPASLQSICEEAATGQGWLVDLVRCVCPDDEAAAQAMVATLLQDARAAMAGTQDDIDTLLCRQDVPKAGLVHAVTGSSVLFTTFDWKDSDALKSLDLPLPDGALDDFHWDPLDNGDDIGAGIAAARKHLAKRGYALYELPSLGDYYAIGVVKARDKARFKKLVAQAEIKLQI